MKRILDWDTPPRIDVPELIDDATQPYEDFRASMTDVRHANRFLGGTSVVAHQVKIWLRDQSHRQTHRTEVVTFLDVATGSCDLPQEVLRIAQAEGVQARIVGLDYSVPILRLAREEIGNEPNLRLVRGTAFRLPFADRSIDYVLCSLAFHHFGFDLCVAALREIERVARLGWLVNDLRRAWSAWYLFRTVSAVTRMNRLTRHDGPASILRSYSLAEYRAMPEALGLHEGADYLLRRSLFYRVALIRNRSRQPTRTIP
jgi:ubiquinone/menaquinone biosynthesis C-methylase UbiE